MTPEGKLKLKNLLVSHEGLRLMPYADVSGHMTIGVGRNLSDKGITVMEAYYLLDDDILYFGTKLAHYLPFYSDLDENRQIALVDMAFNIGIQGILNFTFFIEAMTKGEYVEASRQMLDSAWAKQVGMRAQQLADIIRTGDL
jgi:lysozyme